MKMGIKRLMDIVLSIIFLVMGMPIMIIISLLIRIEDHGPILFLQKRVGLNNQPFIIYKFRSMKKNTPVKKYEFNDTGVPDDFIFKKSCEKDVYVTRVGNIIRKTSLDELPQLFNILIGNMSFIGPRPEIPEIADYYNDYQKKRLLMKPGLSGLAQVSGRSDITNGRKIELDIYYIEHYSFLLDIKIFFQTIAKVIRFEGAV